jgi:elongation factor Ts
MEEPVKCDHGIVFDAVEAKKLIDASPPEDSPIGFIMGSPATDEIRRRWPRLDGPSVPTGQGTIAIASIKKDGKNRFCMVELGTQTDFAANTEVVRHSAAVLAANGVLDIDRPEENTAILLDAKARTGEHVQLNRATFVGFDGADLVSFGEYLHHDRKTGVVVVFATDSGAAEITEDTKKDVAMHVAAAQPRPVAVEAKDVPESLVNAERLFVEKNAKASGKPESIQAKMIAGGMNKFLASVSLLEQPFIKDPKKKIKDILPAGTRVMSFTRWEVGG